jgi:hypothetical protein
MWVSGDWGVGEPFAEAHVLKNEGSEDVGKSEQRFVHNNMIFIIISAYYPVRSNAVSIACCPAVVVGSIVLPLTTRTTSIACPRSCQA